MILTQVGTKYGLSSNHPYLRDTRKTRKNSMPPLFQRLHRLPKPELAELGRDRVRFRASSRTKSAKPSQEPSTNRTVELSVSSVLKWKSQRRHTRLICGLTAFQLPISSVHIAEGSMSVATSDHCRGSLVNAEEACIL